MGAQGRRPGEARIIATAPARVKVPSSGTSSASAETEFQVFYDEAGPDRK